MLLTFYTTSLKEKRNMRHALKEKNQKITSFGVLFLMISPLCRRTSTTSSVQQQQQKKSNQSLQQIMCFLQKIILIIFFLIVFFFPLNCFPDVVVLVIASNAKGTLQYLS